jgi:hypothetical protein
LLRCGSVPNSALVISVFRLDEERKVKKSYVDSLFVNRSTGEKVQIRTFYSRRGDTYAIWANHGFVGQYTKKSSVRAYIMRNDCMQVESF